MTNHSIDAQIERARQFAGCFVHEHPVKGWRLEQIKHVRHLGRPSAWFAEMMRAADGATVSYVSPAGLKEAIEGVSRAAVAADKEQEQ